MLPWVVQGATRVIEPMGGRLVAFFSEFLIHEVLCTRSACWPAVLANISYSRSSGAAVVRAAVCAVTMVLWRRERRRCEGKE